MFLVRQVEYPADDALIDEIDACHERISRARRTLFGLIAEVDRLEAWRNTGARDIAHWLWMRYGISEWKAHRWVASARALSTLPLVAEAFASGVLSTDKVVELTRFATPGTEAELVNWALGASCGAIRRRGDLAAATAREDVVDADRARSLA